MKRTTLEEILPLVKQIDMILGDRYHVALGGSMLTEGSSTKDMDLFIYPHTTELASLEEVHSYLKALPGMKKVFSTRFVHRQWRKQGSKDTKAVEVWVWGKLRIDIFYPWFVPLTNCQPL